ncbi:hypothetical protein [Flavobacterium lipolyticum]|uniref:Uncharacterized protein n=1 Tax=Flavobacterium lipolyticum TaxID=2893754 RepID=A0ABS8M5Z4_9FLAO|nr:hypothetical protein [Flavobacterium sp. F-126]MCC9020221.1 hypothetical protein [Flavobacterium sp. F-126]
MSMSLKSYSQKFEIVNSSFARNLMSKSEPKLVKNLERNNCPVYKLDNNQFLVYSSISKFSILFKDIKNLKEIETVKTFSIDLETEDVRESEQERILNIASSANDYIKDLEKKFNINLDLKNLSNLDILDEKIKEFGVENLSEKEVFAVSIYLDEFFRNNTETYWSIEKVFTLNTYWIPFLKSKNDNKEYSFYRTLFKSYNDNESGYLNLKLNYLLELAKYKNIPVLSKEHIDFIKSFQTTN